MTTNNFSKINLLSFAYFSSDDPIQAECSFCYSGKQITGHDIIVIKVIQDAFLFIIILYTYYLLGFEKQGLKFISLFNIL